MTFIQHAGASILFALLWVGFFLGFGALLRWLWGFGRGDDPRHPPLRL